MKGIFKKVGAGVGLLAAGTGVAMADSTAAIASLTGVSGDVETIGWAVLGVLIVAAGFKYMRRAI
ncbi:Bacteriophage coat protein B [Halopseudomonas litoralis]|uniref:Bacteriophage coat protein B n=1 Tax=Halopseudomonas litoralis TaxID=797277 RepID=A0A1H1L877_9GAMM|nr:major capsid protein [Halopseudomonas litoralis]SDR70255.1 Bacteriophage coat protein B [Halopseudomonas litoralis]